MKLRRLPPLPLERCRERWHNHLDPRVKKGDWTADEDQLIINMQAKLGNQWAKITRMLPGRTDNAARWLSALSPRARERARRVFAAPLTERKPRRRLGPHR